MSKAISLALRAIEAGSDVNEEGEVVRPAGFEGLLAFCETHGLPQDEAEKLLEQPGPSDFGRVSAALARLEQPEPEAPPATPATETLPDDDEILIVTDRDG